jgi:hypothetical protein
MQRGVLVIQSGPRAGREREYEEFNDTTHVPEVLATPGFAAAARYRAVRSPLLPARPDDEWRSHLTIYQIVSEDVVASYQGLLDRMAQGALSASDVFDVERPYRSQLFELVFEA